jgi:hypothetical protein
MNRSNLGVSRDVLPMTVDNMTFLVERLAQDCAPLQFVRELTVNSIQALLLAPQAQGTVVWDVDWFYFEQAGVYKLSCIDTGVGMTGPEMVEYINKLSSSIHEQGASKNFGIGAKIAAASRNRHGLIYKSWKGGRGAMVELYFDSPAGVYGLRRWPENDGEFWTSISDELKPAEIHRHGTMVTLLGNSDRQNTLQPPERTPMPSRWLYRYLNTRFFAFPSGVTVRTREGWELPRSNTKHNFLRKVETQGSWLKKNNACQGNVDLGDAVAHWWILKEGIDVDSGHNAPGGHVAALFQNELYEMALGRSGISRLQSFGVVFGAGRVVIYVQPLDEKVISNTARTNLLIDNSPLDWSRWAAEFREKLPEELVNLQNEISARSGEKDHRRAIMERLRQIHDLLKFSRFRVSEHGVAALSEAPGSAITTAEKSNSERSGTAAKKAKNRARGGDVYALYAQSGDVRGNPRDDPNEPQPKWISESDGTRTPPDLDDRAAKFSVETNLILINADFRVFTDMVERWSSAYAHVAGARAMVEDVVHEWFEQELIETVMSALALHKAGGISFEEASELWTETSLTAAVLARYHIDQVIKRQLGQRLGSLKAA